MSKTLKPSINLGFRILYAGAVYKIHKCGQQGLILYQVATEL